MARKWATTGTSPIAYPHMSSWEGKLDSAKLYSISLWFVLPAYVTGTDTFFITKSDTQESATTTSLFSVLCNGTSSSAGLIKLLANGWATTGGVFTIPGPAAAAATWHHLAISYNGNATTNKPIIYLDGVAQTVTTATTPVGTYTFPDTAPIYLGNDNGGSFALNGGSMADVAIWNAILSPTDMPAIYKQGLRASQIRPETLVFYVPMIGISNPEVDYVGRFGGLTNWNAGGASVFTPDPPKLVAMNFSTQNPYSGLRMPITFAQTLTGTSSAAGSVQRGITQNLGGVNQVTNPTFSGAASGTPGTDPTNMVRGSVAGGSALTKSIVGVGVENGLSYIDVRWNGTSGAGSGDQVFLTLCNKDANVIPAAVNQSWFLSLDVKLVGGTTTNITSHTIQMNEYDVSTSYLTSDNPLFFTPTGSKATYSGTTTTTDSNVAQVNMQFVVGVSSSVAIDATYRLYNPVFQHTGATTSVIDTLTRRGIKAQTTQPATIKIPSRNYIPNSAMTGGVTGTPGTMPPGWNYTSAAGVTRNIVAFGTASGLPYIDLRFSGTTVGSQQPQVEFTDNTSIVYNVGDTWVESFYATLISGTPSGCACFVSFNYFDAAQNYLTNSASVQFTPDATVQRVSTTDSEIPPKAAFVAPYFFFTTTGSTAFDFTIRLYAPQMERGSTPTPFVLTPNTGLMARTISSAKTTVANTRIPSRNYVPNSAASGMVIGTPGTLPTGWNMDLGTGVSQNVVGSGTVSGLPYLDVRFFGTTTGAQQTQLEFTNNTDIPFKNGDTWIESFYATLVAGSPTGCSLKLAFNYLSGAQGYLDNSPTITFVPDTTVQRVTTTGSASVDRAAYVAPYFLFISTGSTAFDFTIRLYAPQMERGSTATPFVLTPNTGLIARSSTKAITAGTPLTMNPSDKNASITLSNGNLTVTGVGAGDKGIRGTGSRTTGKWYYEYTMTSGAASPGSVVGFANATESLATYLGKTNNSVGEFESANADILMNDALILTTADTLTNGSTIGCAIDIDNKLVWFYVAGRWNGGSGNPALGTGGTSVSALTGAIFPAISINGTNVGTFNFGASSWINTQPAGFLSWINGSAVIGTLAKYKIPVISTIVNAVIPTRNRIANSAMTGAVTGTPGTLPTGWNSSVQLGLTSNVVSSGTVNGLPYIDWRVFGTTATTLQTQLEFGANTSIISYPGDTWTESFYYSLVGGTLTGVSAIFSDFNYFAGDGTLYLAETGGSSLTPDATLQRAPATGTSPASTAFVAPYLKFNTSGGVAVDVTFRIAAPQMERGSTATPFALTPNTGLMARTISSTIANRTTWNPSDKNPTITLSNANITATNAGSGSTYVAARATLPRTTGRFYFEVTLTTFAGSSQVGIGLGTAAATLSGYIGQETISIGYFPNVSGSGSVYTNGGLIATAGLGAQGDVIGVAVDLTNQRLWFRVNGGAFIKGGVSIDITAATPTDSFSYSGFATTLVYPMVNLFAPGDQMLANFGASAFANPLPAGFSAWDTTKMGVIPFLAGVKSSTGATLAATAVVAVITSLRRSVATTKTVTTSVLTSLSKTLTATRSTTSSVITSTARKASMSRSTTISAITSLLKSSATTRTTTITVLTSISRTLALTRSVATNVATALIRKITALRSTTSSIVASLTPVAAKNKALTTSASVIASVLRTLTVLRSTSASVVTTISRKASATRSTTITIATSVLHALATSRTATTSIVASLAKSATRPVTTTVNVLTSLVRKAALAVTTSVSVLTSIARSQAITRTTSISVIATLTQSKAKLQALTAIIPIVAALLLGKPARVSAVTSVITALPRALARSIATSISVIASITRRSAVSRSATTSIVATIVAIKAKLQTLAATVPVAASVLRGGIPIRVSVITSVITSLPRSLARALAASISVITSMLRKSTIAKSATVTIVGTLAAIKVKLQTVAASISGLASFTRVSPARVTIAVTPLATIARSPSRLLTASNSIIASIRRVLAATRSASIAVVETLAPLKERTQSLPAIITVTTTLRRALTHTSTVTVSAITSISRVLGRSTTTSISAITTIARSPRATKSAAAAVLATFTAIKSKSQALTTSITTVTSLVKSKTSRLTSSIGVAATLTKNFVARLTSSASITASMTHGGLRFASLTATTNFAAALSKTGGIARTVIVTPITTTRMGVAIAVTEIVAVLRDLKTTFAVPAGTLLAQTFVVATLTKSFGQRLVGLVSGLAALLRGTVYDPTRDFTIVNDSLSPSPTVIAESISQPTIINERLDV